MIWCVFIQRFFSVLYSDSQKSIENGIITQLRAEWILPEDKKLEVTLKELKKDKYLSVNSWKCEVNREKKFVKPFQLNFLGIHEIGRNME